MESKQRLARISSIFCLPLEVCVVTLLTLACQPPTSTPVAKLEATPSKTQAATETSIPTPTLARTPPALPGIYESIYLNSLDAPHTYMGDACQYLRDKWSSQNSPPGTIVMIIMLHSINKHTAEGQDAVTIPDFEKMMEELHAQQFQAIDAQQLADFLENNAKIPPRSVVLVQDGRRYAENFDKHFRPYWDEWNWPVVNAWDIQANTTEALWNENIALEKEGWVDHQVYAGQIPAGADHLSDQFFTDLFQPPLAVFQQRFEKTPIAISWPGAPVPRLVEVARQLGYRLGFTANPRGPVMFNWIPLADHSDNARPSYFPEGPLNDPLMTLPRYWPYQVYKAVDAVRLAGKNAGVYAEQNKASEMGYYDIVCAPSLGPIP